MSKRNTLVQLAHCAPAALSLAWRSAPRLIAVYVGLALIGGIFPVAASWLLKMIIDHLAAGSSSAALIGLTVCLAMAGIGQGAIVHVNEYVNSETQRRIGRNSQVELFSAVNRFGGIAPFEDPDFLDKIRLAKHSGSSAPHQVINSLINFLRAAITITGFLGSLLVLGPLMALFVSLFAAPVLAAEISLSNRRGIMLWAISPAERREIFYDQLLTTPEAAKEVRLFGIGDFLLGRMRQERETADGAKRTMDLREARIQSTLAVLAACVSGVGLLWAVYQTRSGSLSIGDISIFVAAVAGVQSSLAQSASAAGGVHQALISYEYYRAVTTSESDVFVPEVPQVLSGLQDSIEFKNVWFRYSDEHPWILEGVNLKIVAGQSLGIVGLNGAGKSTLIKLLCRFYDPTEGVILWDGTDTRQADVVHLREHMSVVFQDFMQFDMTVRENIGLGDLDALEDDERIIAAARRAGVSDAINALPKGYDTLLTRMFFAGADNEAPEVGVHLSGGQQQRLALARSFVRAQRDLLILDEPSSGLDAEAEYEIHSSLRKFRQGKTSLLVSHRLGSLRDSDRIVVLSDGRILEDGTHSELMRIDGEYSRLFQIQASGYQEGETIESSGQVAG